MNTNTLFNQVLGNVDAKPLCRALPAASFAAARTSWALDGCAAYNPALAGYGRMQRITPHLG